MVTHYWQKILIYYKKTSGLLPITMIKNNSNTAKTECISILPEQFNARPSMDVSENGAISFGSENIILGSKQGYQGSY